MLLTACLPLFAMAQEPAPAPAQAPTTAQLEAGAAAMGAYQAARGGVPAATAGLPLRGVGSASWAIEGMDDPIAVTATHVALGHGIVISDSPAGRMEEAADGAFAWYEDAMMNTIREQAQAEELMRRWGVTQGADWSAMYASAALVGTEELDGRDCLKLDLVQQDLIPRSEPGPGQPQEEPSVAPDTWFLDAETHLPVRTFTRGPGALGAPTEVRVDWSDWRAVDGVSYPFALDITISDFRYGVAYTSWERAVEVPDDLIAPSEAILAARAEQASPEALAARREPRLETIDERHFASIRLQCAQSEMQTVLSAALPESFMAAMNSGVDLAGPPTVLYHQWGDRLDLEAGVPMAGAIEAKGRVAPSTLAGGQAVVVWHIGPYERLGESHAKVQAFLAERELAQRAPFWEEYHTDPGVEPDPEQWRTKIVMPVQPAEKQ